MAEAHNERVKAKRKYSRPVMFDYSTSGFKPLPIKQLPPKKKALMNKTELAFKAELERRGHKIILCQALTFWLADGSSYRPDFVVVDICDDDTVLLAPLRLTAYETKGQHRFKREGITKLKFAAEKYPFIRFVLVERDGSKWTEKAIGNQ